MRELTPTTVTLQMADITMEKPEGVIEDVLVKVGKFIFPVDFIILDMEEDSQVPLLLGRPFLATGAALIDMQKGVLTLRVGEEATDFNMLQSLKNLDTDREDYNMPIQNRMAQVRRNKLQDSYSTSQDRAT